MSERDRSLPARIGRPPKVDEHGTPTRERLLAAAVDACVEFGYEGVTLADIARRAGVSTPAVYSHFDSKAALLVEASQHELQRITTARLPDSAGLRELLERWLEPENASTRILIAELHAAAVRQPDVAGLLRTWQQQNARHIRRLAGLSTSEVKLFYVVILGLTHVDQLDGLGVSARQTRSEMNEMIDHWLGDRYS